MFPASAMSVHEIKLVWYVTNTYVVIIYYISGACYICGCNKCALGKINELYKYFSMWSEFGNSSIVIFNCHKP